MDNVYIKYSSDNTVEVRVTKSNLFCVVMLSSPRDKATNFSVEHPTIIGRVSAYKTTRGGGVHPIRRGADTQEIQNLILSCQNDCYAGIKTVLFSHSTL